MRRLRAVAGLAALLAITSAAGCAAETPKRQLAAQSPKHQLVLRKHVVVDQQGFGYEAFHVLVPQDWSFQGGVVWNFGKLPPEAKAAYTITSPGGRAVIEQLPAMNMAWSQSPMMAQSFAQAGFIMLQPMEAADFLKNVYLRQARPDATEVRIVESQPLPELARRTQEINQFLMNVFAQISPFQFPFEQRADAARVKFEYTQGGKKMVEDVTASVSYFISTTSSIYSGMVQTVNWEPSVTSFRAPAEEFEQSATAYKIVIATRQDNPRWGVEYTRLAATVTREQLRQQEAIFQRMQQIHRTQEEISDMLFDSYQKRSAAYDRIFDNYSQSLRGVDTYLDPVNHSKVEVPVGYDHAWTNGNDYVFSDSASFDPNLGSNLNWQKMNRER